MRSILMENVVTAAGAQGNTEKLNSNGGFVSQFKRLVAAEHGLSDWANSHVSMDGFGAAFEAERQSKVTPVFEQTVEIAKQVLAS